MNRQPSNEALTLAGKIVDLEKQLDKLKKEADQSGDHQQVNGIRKQLRDKYAALIHEDYVHAVRTKADLNLWKKVFYYRVGAYQKQLTRANASRKDPAKKERADVSYRQLVKSVEKFLSDAIAFYRDLTASMLSACDIQMEGYTNGEATKVKGIVEGEIMDHMIGTCYKTLVQLGDLERYVQRHCRDPSRQDHTGAAEHYRAAGRLLPAGSNHCNQLGVISQLEGNKLDAFFHYVRAYHVDPGSRFLQASQNVQKNLENVNTAWKDVEQESSSSPAAFKPWASAGADEQKRRVKNLELKFLKLHSLLYFGDDMSLYPTIEQSFFTDMMTLLDVQGIGSAELTKMAAICIWAGSDSDHGVKDRAAADQCRNLAITLCFRLFERISVLARAAERSSLLAPLALISEWVHHDVERLMSDWGGAPGKSARQSFVASLVDLLNLTNASKSSSRVSTATSSIPDYVPIDEDVQLLGFLPLQETHRQSIAPLIQRNMLIGVPAAAGDKDARLIRLGRLENLAQLLALSRPHPFVFFSSHTGEYSVESQGGGSVAGGKQVYTQDNIPGVIRLPRGQRAGKTAAPAPHFEEADLLEADAANDETFGDAMVPVEPFGDFAGFSRGAGGGGKAPEAGEEASDAFFENLVEQCIEGGDGDRGGAGAGGGRGGGAGSGQVSIVDDDDDDQEEIILFRPTGRGADSKLQHIPGGIGSSASGGGMWEGGSFQIAASNVSGGLWGPASPLAGLMLPTASGAQAGLRDGCDNAEYLNPNS